MHTSAVLFDWAKYLYSVMKKTALALFFLIGASSSYAQIESIKIEKLSTLINKAQNNIVVVNFWATFCKPCLEEIPAFIKTSKSNQNISLMLVSVDARDVYTQKLNKFVQKHMRNSLVYWLDETDASYFCPIVDPSWEGTIPATLIVNKRNNKRFFVEGEMSEKELLFRLTEIEK